MRGSSEGLQLKTKNLSYLERRIQELETNILIIKHRYHKGADANLCEKVIRKIEDEIVELYLLVDEGDEDEEH